MLDQIVNVTYTKKITEAVRAVQGNQYDPSGNYNACSGCMFEELNSSINCPDAEADDGSLRCVELGDSVIFVPV